MGGDAGGDRALAFRTSRSHDGERSQPPPSGSGTGRRDAAMTELNPKAARDAQETAWRAAEGDRLLVVGIGASAGGLEAFERFLRRAPPASGIAFVLVQHLDPEHESILAEILGRATDMPVAFAQDGEELQPDHVHVMPRDTTLLVESGKLRLVPAETHGVRHPINAFLTSLAEDQRENAAGVV